MIVRRVCFTVLCLSAAACTQDADDGDSYYPLSPGLHWTYRVTIDVAGKQEIRT